jgi:hypothetical protein
MRKVPVILALGAALGGAASMILMATAPRNSLTLPIFIVAMIITFGALSTARRLARGPGRFPPNVY